MNTDEKISAILRMEADAVEPSAAGYDAIRNGIAARRRRTWWLRGGAFGATALATAVALVVLAADPSPRTIQQPPASAGPSVTSAPATVEPTVAPVPDATPLGAIWPLTTYGELRAWQRDNQTYPSLSSASFSALGFARNYLLSPDATVASVDERDGSMFFEMRRDTVVVSTLELRGFGDGGTAPYLVVAARSDSVKVTAPAADDVLTSPLRARGTFREVDPGILVRLRADGPGSAPIELGDARATYAPPDLWEAEVGFTTTATTGSVMVTMGSKKDEGIAGATVVPVTFAKGPGAATGDVFAGQRSGRIAVFGPDGTFLRYLTTGTGTHPDVSPDGKRVVWANPEGACLGDVVYGPVSGGATVTVADRLVAFPVWAGDGRIAYATTGCIKDERSEIVLYDLATKTRRTVTTTVGLVDEFVASPDGRYLAWLNNGTVTTYEIASGATRTTEPAKDCSLVAFDIAGTTTAGQPILVTASLCGVALVVERFARTAPDRDRVYEGSNDSVTYHLSFDEPSGTLLISHGPEDAPSYTELVSRDGSVTKVPDLNYASW
ncbi:MAG TPA: hypothetical protein VF519_17360 [Mycobacteriales bacterium]|jgi:hypothetical protein